jgi:hypothetical protein
MARLSHLIATLLFSYYVLACLACKDLNHDCASWASQGECKSNIGYVRRIGCTAS